MYRKRWSIVNESGEQGGPVNPPGEQTNTMPTEKQLFYLSEMIKHNVIKMQLEAMGMKFMGDKEMTIIKKAHVHLIGRVAYKI